MLSPESLIDPQPLQQWLTELPWLDTERTATCLLDALQHLEKTTLPLRQREQLLAIYHPHLVQITGALLNGLLDATLPLPTKVAQQTQLLLELCDTMIRNHTRLVLHQDFFEGDSIIHSQAIGRTLDWLARSALHHSQAYMALGKSFWETFYRIFRLVEQHRLLPAPNASHHELRTHLFRPLVLSVTGPQRFRQRELQQIDQFLQHFAHWALIHQQPIRRSHKAGFFFDWSIPQPPRNVKLLSRDNQSNTLRFLFLQALTRRLLGYVNAAEPQGMEIMPFAQARKLALKLAHIYGVPRQRRWHRFKEKEKKDCRLVVGLEDLIATLGHHNLAYQELQSLLPNPPDRNKANLLFDTDFELLIHEDEADTDDPHSEVDCFRLLKQQKPIRREDIWSRFTPNGDTQTDSFPAQLADTSARGYRLVWLDRSVPKLKLGEILGILQPDGTLEITAIRWLQTSAEQGLNVGVELLSFTAQVVVVALKIPTDSTVKPQQDWGLLLPAQPAIQRPTGLLVPSFTWQKGQWVDIYCSKQDKTTYCLQRLLDSTPAYDLFALEPIG